MNSQLLFKFLKRKKDDAQGSVRACFRERGRIMFLTSSGGFSSRPRIQSFTTVRVSTRRHLSQFLSARRRLLLFLAAGRLAFQISFSQDHHTTQGSYDKACPEKERGTEKKQSMYKDWEPFCPPAVYIIEGRRKQNDAVRYQYEDDPFVNYPLYAVCSCDER